MSTVAWVMVGYLALNSLFCISQVGKPRNTYSPRDAVIGVIMSGLFIWGIVTVAS